MSARCSIGSASVQGLGDGHLFGIPGLVHKHRCPVLPGKRLSLDQQLVRAAHAAVHGRSAPDPPAVAERVAGHLFLQPFHARSCRSPQYLRLFLGHRAGGGVTTRHLRVEIEHRVSGHTPHPDLLDGPHGLVEVEGAARIAVGGGAVGDHLHAGQQGAKVVGLRLAEGEQPVVHRSVVGVVLGGHSATQLGVAGVDVGVDQPWVDQRPLQVSGGCRRGTGADLPIRADRDDDSVPDGDGAVHEDAAPGIHGQDATVPEQQIDPGLVAGFAPYVSTSCVQPTAMHVVRQDSRGGGRVHSRRPIPKGPG